MAEPLDDADGKRSVLGRAFDILDCFRGGRIQSVSSLCEETGLPPATVHRTLANLTETGVVERASRGQYRLGRRLTILGNDVPGHMTLREASRPCLVDLHRMTGEIAVRASIDGHTMLVVDVIAGRSASQSRIVPRDLPLTDSAPGLAYLAHQPHEEAVSRFTGRPDEAKIRHTLGEIRRVGVAVVRDAASTWVSAPVVDQTGMVRTTLSSVVPANHSNIAGISRLVNGAAGAVAHELNKQLKAEARTRPYKQVPTEQR